MQEREEGLEFPLSPAKAGSKTIENRELLILVRFAAKAGPVSRFLTEQPAGRCSSHLHLADTGRSRVLGSQRGRTGCGLSCNPVPSLASHSPGSGFFLSRAGAHTVTQFIQTLLRKFNFPTPAHWRHGNRPNDEEVERCVAVICIWRSQHASRRKAKKGGWGGEIVRLS